MKLMLAVIRNEMYFETTKALEDAGFFSFSGKDVLGRGKSTVEFDVVKATDDKDVYQPVLYSKKMLQIYLAERDVQSVIDILVKVNKHSHSGDGKIFILPVEKVLRIRTEEENDDALL